MDLTVSGRLQRETVFHHPGWRDMNGQTDIETTIIREHDPVRLTLVIISFI